VDLVDLSPEALRNASWDKPAALKTSLDTPPEQDDPKPAVQATTEAEPPRRIRRPAWLETLRDEDPPD
jgi:hypothetical protein